MSYLFHMPAISIMGQNALADTGPQIRALGFKKALIVTDKILHDKLNATEPVINMLIENKISYAVFDGTHPNPTIADVNAGLELLKQTECDFIISFGGGSPHDCAKGIAILATNGGDIRDYEGLDKIPGDTLPIVAINTTAGTASEMTKFSIITDEYRHVKMAIVDWHVTPKIAVNDPALMVGMPRDLTAATGMDALTHSIEAVVSTAATPITDACALKAIALIFEHLPTAVEDGANLEARDQLAYAEYLGGMAFNNASLGYVHAMAHQLGGFYDLPHGVCNAILLPSVEEFNGKFVPQKFESIAKAIGIDCTNLSDSQIVDKVIAQIRKLASSIGIPASLSELGVKNEDLTTLAKNALKDACGLTNPKQATLEEIIQIYKNAL